MNYWDENKDREGRTGRIKACHDWDKLIGFRSDWRMDEQLTEIADREGVSKSALLRDICQRAIKQRNSTAWRERLFDPAP